MMDEPGPRKGVKTKLFGVLLIILGALDSMLSWRGGFAPSSLYVFLLSAGMALYGIGSIRGSIRGTRAAVRGDASPRRD